MKPYRFQLETLLELRRETRQEAQMRLADALRAEDVLLSQLADLQQQLAVNQETQREAASQTALDVNRLLSEQRYQMVVRSQVTALGEKIGQVRNEIERRREIVAAADAEVKALEKFDSRRREQHARDLRRTEQKQLDEVAAQAFTQLRPTN